MGPARAEGEAMAPIISILKRNKYGNLWICWCYRTSVRSQTWIVLPKGLTGYAKSILCCRPHLLEGDVQTPEKMYIITMIQLLESKLRKLPQDICTFWVLYLELLSLEFWVLVPFAPSDRSSNVTSPERPVLKDPSAWSGLPVPRQSLSSQAIFPSWETYQELTLSCSCPNSWVVYHRLGHSLEVAALSVVWFPTTSSTMTGTH